MRDSAENGSPCEPVARHRTSLRGIAGDLGVANLHPGRDTKIPEPLGDLRVLDHAAADEGDLAIELRRQIHEDLHAVDAGRKRRDHQAPRRARENFLERLDHLRFRPGETAAVDVRAVGKEAEHAGGSELREPVDVEMLAVDRRLVDLEVAGVHDDAERRVNRQRDAVGHAVRHADELDGQRPDAHPIAGAHGVQIDPVVAVLAELRFDHRERQRCRVDRSLEQAHHVRDAPDVILVSMRQNERRHVPLLLQVGQIGNDPIHPQQLGVREHHAGVDDDRGLAPAECEHVHAELAETAESYNFEHVEFELT